LEVDHRFFSTLLEINADRNPRVRPARERKQVTGFSPHLMADVTIIRN
jgi:hypothetical protein